MPRYASKTPASVKQEAAIKLTLLEGCTGQESGMQNQSLEFEVPDEPQKGSPDAKGIPSTAALIAWPQDIQSSSMKARKTWQQKLSDSKGLPKVGKIEGKLSTRWGGGTMVIPAPIEVKELMDKIPKGKITTINEVRNALAKRHGVDIACPITTGIFSWIAAHAAEEAAAEGRKRITPYWRTLKSGGELNPKYPGGISGLRAHLEAEGLNVVQKGKRFFVQGYSDRLFSM